MGGKSVEQRIAELKERTKALEARVAKTEKANETRRKILLGTLVLERLNGADSDAAWLRQWLAKELPQYLKRDYDRKIFDGLIASGGGRNAG